MYGKRFMSSNQKYYATGCFVKSLPMKNQRIKRIESRSSSSNVIVHFCEFTFSYMIQIYGVFSMMQAFIEF